MIDFNGNDLHWNVSLYNIFCSHNIYKSYLVFRQEYKDTVQYILTDKKKKFTPYMIKLLNIKLLNKIKKYDTTNCSSYYKANDIKN